MIVLWALLGVGLALAGELTVGRFAPGLAPYVAVMSLPLVTYALRTSQRSSMLVGCASGLLQDYWIEPHLFGLNGLVKTFLGWALGGLGTRFDLNNLGGRFAAGASLQLVDEGLQAGLRRLFGDAVLPVTPASLVLRAVSGGVMTVVALAIVSKLGTSRRAAAKKQRKA